MSEDYTVSPASLLSVQVSMFSSVTRVKPADCLPLELVLTRIKHGAHQHQITHLRDVLATQGKAAYDAARKENLPAFTPAGVFPRRGNANLTEASGLVHFDFDHPPDLAAAKALLSADPYIAYAFVSPSGDGLKAAVWTDGIEDDRTYKHAWGTVLAYFERTYPDLAIANDKGCKDIARLCFVSHDPDFYSNPEPRKFDVPPYQPPEPKPKPTPKLKPASHSTPPPLPANRRERYAQQAIDTAVQMIQAGIPKTNTAAGTRHESQLKAAKLLGGYVAGEVLSQAEAYAALEGAVANNTSDFALDMETIMDGLRYGEAEPITLEQLEAERLDWLDTQRATLTVTSAHADQNGTTGEQTTTQQTASQPPSALPDIYLNTEITRIVNEAEDALLKLPRAPVVYQRARHLVCIAYGTEPPKWLHRPADMPVIVDASAARLTELASQAAQWWKYDKRAKKWEAALPPGWVIETLHSRPAWLFPPLEGIITSPTLRPDGSVLDIEGYDASTGLYLDSNGTDFPELSAHPTIDDARSAIGALQEAVQDFPFAEPHHFSATLAAMLSLVCRFAIQGNVPLFAIRANTRGSGKSLLADVVSIVGTGRAAPRWPQARDDAEDDKRLFTVALAGYACLHVDNVTRPLGSPALDVALTSSTFSGRVLGTNESREVPLSMVWLASGNNMQFQDDTARRILPIDLDPKMERPEERTGFVHDPLIPWLQQERPRLTIAALTIARAFFEAGCPSQGSTAMGSFEQWSDLVRHALIWAGEADPNEGRKNLEAESNPEYEQLAVLLAAWAQCYPKHDAWTLAQVKDDIQLRAAVAPKPANTWNSLQEALGACDQKYDEKSFNMRVLGNAFSKFQGRTIGGQRFIKAGKSHNAQLWKIEQL